MKSGAVVQLSLRFWGLSSNGAKSSAKAEVLACLLRAVFMGLVIAKLSLPNRVRRETW